MTELEHSKKAIPLAQLAWAWASPIAIIGIGVGGVAASLICVPGVPGGLGSALALLMLAIAVIDRQRLIIPNSLNATAVVLGVAHAAAQSPDVPGSAMATALLRGLALAIVLLSIRLAYAHWRGREGLGLGDVKLAAAAGTWLDWTVMPIALEIAAVAALAAYGLLHLTGRRISATTRLPFGLFFAPAIWVCWLLERTLLSAY